MRPDPVDHVDEGGDRRLVLQVDVDPDVGPGAQEVLHQRDADLTEAGLSHGLPGELGDDPAAVGHPVEHVVVEGHQHVVGGGVGVGL